MSLPIGQMQLDHWWSELLKKADNSVSSVQLPGINFDTSELLVGRRRSRLSTVFPPSLITPP